MQYLIEFVIELGAGLATALIIYLINKFARKNDHPSRKQVVVSAKTFSQPIPQLIGLNHLMVLSVFLIWQHYILLYIFCKQFLHNFYSYAQNPNSRIVVLLAVTFGLGFSNLTCGLYLSVTYSLSLVRPTSTWEPLRAAHGLYQYASLLIGVMGSRL